MQKLRMFLVLIYNYIRFPIHMLLSGLRIKVGISQFISPLAIVRVDDKHSSILIGEKAYIRTGTVISANEGGKISIGNKVFMNRNCMVVCKKNITIGNRTTIGPNVMIFDHDHRITMNNREGFTKEAISIGDNVWIGANVVILKGTHIGNDCVIGAGTVIKGDIPEGKIVYQERSLKFKDIK